MQPLTFPILAIAAIALWTVANCVGVWARQLDNRVNLLQFQIRAQQFKQNATQNKAPSDVDFNSVDILDDPGDVIILDEKPEPMQQAA